MTKTAKDIKKLSPFDKYEGERRTEIKAYGRSFEYRGFKVRQNKYIPVGANGYWEVPELKFIAPGGIQEGFLTVSMTQAREAIDKWFMLNEQLKNL